jgi:hypothetical protein
MRDELRFAAIERLKGLDVVDKAFARCQRIQITNMRTKDCLMAVE